MYGQYPVVSLRIKRTKISGKEGVSIYSVEWIEQLHYTKKPALVTFQLQTQLLTLPRQEKSAEEDKYVNWTRMVPSALHCQTLHKHTGEKDAVWQMGDSGEGTDGPRNLRLPKAPAPIGSWQNSTDIPVSAGWWCPCAHLWLFRSLAAALWLLPPLGPSAVQAYKRK